MMGVVYPLMCKYKAFYVGKTKHVLWQGIYDHTYYIINGNLGSPFGRHFEKHDYKTDGLIWTVLYSCHSSLVCSMDEVSNVYKFWNSEAPNFRVYEYTANLSKKKVQLPLIVTDP